MNKEITPVNHELVNPKEKPIHFSFGAHASGAHSFLESYYKEIEISLLNTSGVVLLGLEGYGNSPEFLEKIEKSIEEGDEVGWAYVFHELAESLGRAPTMAEIRKRIKDKRNDKIQDFRLSELIFIDELREKYPGRVKIMFEETDKNVINSRLPKELTCLYDEGDEIDFSSESSYHKKKAVVALMVGNFKTAAWHMGASIRFLDLLSIVREEVFIEGIKSEGLNNPVVSGVFVRFGAGHTFMAHSLKNEGYNVSYSFDGKGRHKSFVFPLENVITRHMRANPESKVCDTHTFRALVADYLVTSATEMFPDTLSIGSEIYLYGLIPYINHLVIQKLTTEKQLGEFAVLNRKNHIKAVNSLLRNVVEQSKRTMNNNLVTNQP